MKFEPIKTAGILIFTVVLGCAFAKESSLPIPERQNPEFKPKVLNKTVFLPEGIEIKVTNTEAVPFSVTIGNRIYKVYMNREGKIKVTWSHR
jgi:hypothetical protein